MRVLVLFLFLLPSVFAEAPSIKLVDILWYPSVRIEGTRAQIGGRVLGACGSYHTFRWIQGGESHDSSHWNSTVDSSAAVDSLREVIRNSEFLVP